MLISLILISLASIQVLLLIYFKQKTDSYLRNENLAVRQESLLQANTLRTELQNSLKNFNDSLLKNIIDLTALQNTQLSEMRHTLEHKLTNLQSANQMQLEAMRQTVAEKLQGTLEKRLGDSFKQVSERLEEVHKGLGEMQTLANGVGDLKKVLSNVKTRGILGEIQLGAMLEQVLHPEQYSTNVIVNKQSNARVEFAIKLPGNNLHPHYLELAEEHIWLPIDAKFPLEDYQRLLIAEENADALAAELALKNLELRLKNAAKDIYEKYLHPPYTTDFAILYLPTEGLFAEVMRRPGLAENLQRDLHIVITGPTTLWALINSLQVGFRTLAIQKRSSEVWELLANVKTEWLKYGALLDKVQKKLHEASNTIETAARQNRAIGRQLKDVQNIPLDNVHELPLPSASLLEP